MIHENAQRTLDAFFWIMHKKQKMVFFFSTAGTKNPFFVLCPNVFYAIISVSGPLGGKSYIRTLDTMIFSSDTVSTLGQSPRVEKLSSRENNGVRGTKLLFCAG